MDRFQRTRTADEWKVIAAMLDDAERNGQGKLSRFLAFHTNLPAAEIALALRARGNDAFMVSPRGAGTASNPVAKPGRPTREYQRGDATLDATVFASGMTKGREKLALHLLRNTAMTAAEIIAALAAAPAQSKPMPPNLLGPLSVLLYPVKPPRQAEADPWGDVIAKLNNENARAGGWPQGAQ